MHVINSPSFIFRLYKVHNVCLRSLRTILHSELRYKMGQDFLDIQEELSRLRILVVYRLKDTNSMNASERILVTGIIR